MVYTSTSVAEHANPTEGIPEHLAIATFTQETGPTCVRTYIRFASTQALMFAVALGRREGMNITWDAPGRCIQELPIACHAAG